MITEKQIKIASTFYTARDTMRRLFASSFDEKMATYQGFIKSEMEKKNCNEIIAAMNIVGDLQRDMPDSGMIQALILAACVELIEPSPKEAK